MERERVNFIKSSDVEWSDLGGGVKRQILGYDDQIMMVKVLFESGAVGEIHSHPHIQSSYVASGRFEVEVDGSKSALSAGDGFLVPADAPHGVVCLEAGELIDVFTPMRRDFI